MDSSMLLCGDSAKDEGRVRCALSSPFSLSKLPSTVSQPPEAGGVPTALSSCPMNCPFPSMNELTSAIRPRCWGGAMGTEVVS